ncbi:MULTISPECIES: hypothetical protein [unclassified Mesorhizobium]|uniref:hypothetical protein n=1 Tax=unclassified Mesorhizobium TaxID=325217 RepID=UPI000B2EC140|nr:MULTISPECIES: hypothetical protein [unclassified Mesorhizobium]
MIVYVLPVIASLSLLLMHRRSISLKNPDLLQVVFFRDYILLCSFGYMYFSDMNRRLDHNILKDLISEDSLYNASMAAFIFIIIFMIFYKIFLMANKALFRNVEWRINLTRFKKLLALVTVISCAAMVYYMFYLGSGVVAIFSGFVADDGNQIRASLNQGNRFFQATKILATVWVPMLSFSWFWLFLNRKESVSGIYRLIAILSIILALFASMWALEKSKMVFYILGLIGVWIYSGRPIKVIYWIIFIGISLFLISVAYILTYGDRIGDSSYLFDILEHRIMSQSVGSILAFDLYPHTLPFKGLAGISNSLAAIVGERFSSPYADIIDYMVPENTDISGAMSSFAAGEAYALFGFGGVIVAPIVTAFYFGSLEATKGARDSGVFWAPLYALFFSNPYLASTVYSFFWPIGFFFAMAPFLAIALATELSRKF